MSIRGWTTVRYRFGCGEAIFARTFAEADAARCETAARAWAAAREYKFLGVAAETTPEEAPWSP